MKYQINLFAAVFCTVVGIFDISLGSVIVGALGVALGAVNAAIFIGGNNEEAD